MDRLRAWRLFIQGNALCEETINHRWRHTGNYWSARVNMVDTKHQKSSLMVSETSNSSRTWHLSITQSISDVGNFDDDQLNEILHCSWLWRKGRRRRLVPEERFTSDRVYSELSLLPRGFWKELVSHPAMAMLDRLCWFMINVGVKHLSLHQKHMSGTVNRNCKAVERATSCSSKIFFLQGKRSKVSLSLSDYLS